MICQNTQNIQNLMMLQVFLKYFHRKPTYFSITPSSNRLLLSFLGGRVQLSADIVIWHQFFSKFNFFFLSYSGRWRIVRTQDGAGPNLRKHSANTVWKNLTISNPSLDRLQNENNSFKLLKAQNLNLDKFKSSQVWFWFFRDQNCPNVYFWLISSMKIWFWTILGVQNIDFEEFLGITNCSKSYFGCSQRVKMWICTNSRVQILDFYEFKALYVISEKTIFFQVFIKPWSLWKASLQQPRCQAEFVQRHHL